MDDNLQSSNYDLVIVVDSFFWCDYAGHLSKVSGARWSPGISPREHFRVYGTARVSFQSRFFG